jgi:hypothetical protein
MLKARRGALRSAVTHRRRVMPRSSESSSGSSSEISRGSSAMPHFGQLPGPSWRTSGSIGHVYTVIAEPPRSKLNALLLSGWKANRLMMVTSI